MQCIIILVLFVIKINVSYCFLKNLGAALNFNANTTKLDTTQGTTVRMRDFPHSVLFLNEAGFCAGTILSQKIVLTAAHCFGSSDSIYEMRVYANSRYVLDKLADEHRVWDFILHEKYDKPIEFANDIALIIIRDTFRFKLSVQKAEIINHNRWMSTKVANFKTAGWGVIKKNSKTGNRGIMTAELRYMTQTNCSRMTGTDLTPDMFCLWGETRGDTCQGDSGGGIMLNQKLVGIVSHGGKCGITPGIYINVLYHIEWIQEKVQFLYQQFCRHRERDPDRYDRSGLRIHYLSRDTVK